MQVQALLKKAAALDIQMICPLHGPVLKDDLGFFIGKYDTWSSYKPEDKGVFMPNEEIKKTLIEEFNLKTPVSVERISSIMSRMGFSKGSHRIHGVKTRGWYVYKRSVDEISALKRTLR